MKSRDINGHQRLNGQVSPEPRGFSWRVWLPLLGFILLPVLVQAQNTRPDAPSTRTPKTPPQPPRGKIIDRPRSSRPPGGDTVIAERLDGVVIVKSENDINPEGVKGVRGLQVKGIDWLQTEEFRKVVANHLGQKLTENRLRDLHDDIILYAREKNRPLVDVIYLDQTIADNTVQIWVLEGLVGQVQVRNEGQQWFRNEFIAKQVQLKPGDSVDSEKLASDLDWLNRNPFRSVDVRFQQGTNFGRSDVVLDVEDRIPLRPYIGYEDTGTRYTGEKRLIGGLNWGNAFGLDHQLNYQYTTDQDFDHVQAHSASYVVPLPWRHTLTVFGSYVDASTDFDLATGTNGTPFDNEGKSYQISARYSLPLPRINTYRHEASAGLDFKRSNNDLEFAGTNVLSSSETDIIQFVASYSGLMPDKYGQTSIGLEGYFSPGDLTSRNDDDEFTQLRTGAEAQYVYGRITLERVTPLPYDFSWLAKGLFQWSSARLLPSEELGVGGYRTVRGYDERALNGDGGWIINNEVRTPRFLLGNLLRARGSTAGDYLQFLGFLDYGEIRFIDSPGGESEEYALGTGAGVRFTMSTHLSARLDYGFVLNDVEDSSGNSINRRRNGRVHFGILASF